MRYLVSLGYVGVFLYFFVIAQPYVVARPEDFENLRGPFIPLLATYNGLVGYHLTEVLLLGGFSFRSMVFTMLYFMVIIGFSRQRYVAAPT